MNWRIKLQSEYNDDTIILEVNAKNAGGAVTSAIAHVKRNCPSMGKPSVVWKVSF